RRPPRRPPSAPLPPTRRASDLPCERDPRQPRQAGPALQPQTYGFHDIVPVVGGQDVVGPHTGLHAGEVRVALLASPHFGRLPPGDRKSTRLNSSHVQISYGVIC